MAANNFTSYSSIALADTTSFNNEDWACNWVSPVCQSTQGSETNHISTQYFSPGQPEFFLQNTPPFSASIGANVPFNPVESNEFTGFGSLERSSLQLQNSVASFATDAAITSQWMPQQLLARQQQPEQQPQVPLGEQQLPSQTGPFDLEGFDFANGNLDLGEWQQSDSFLPSAFTGLENILEPVDCVMTGTQDVLADQEVQQQSTQALSIEQPSTQQSGTLSLPELDQSSLDPALTVTSQDETPVSTVNLADILMSDDLDVQLSMSLLDDLPSPNQEVEEQAAQKEPTAPPQQQTTSPGTQKRLSGTLWKKSASKPSQPQPTQPARALPMPALPMPSLLPMPSRAMTPATEATQLSLPVMDEQPSPRSEQSQPDQGQLVDLEGLPTTAAAFHDKMTIDYENTVSGCGNNNTTPHDAAQQPTPDSSSVASPSSPEATPKKAKRKTKGKGKGNGVTTNNNNTPSSQAGPSHDSSAALGPQSKGVEKAKKTCKANACEQCRKSKGKCVRNDPNGPCTRCAKQGLACVKTGIDGRTHKTINQKHSAMLDKYNAMMREVYAQILCFEDAELRPKLFSLDESGDPYLSVSCWLKTHRNKNVLSKRVPFASVMAINASFPGAKLAEQKKDTARVEEMCKHYLATLIQFSRKLQRGEIDTSSIRPHFKNGQWPEAATGLQNEAEVNAILEQELDRNPEPILSKEWHAQYTGGQSSSEAIQL